MTRTYLVTGSASGIGEATVSRLRSEGHAVIGVDVAGGDITVDLTTAEGRAELVSQAAALSGGVLDGVVAVAGLAIAKPITVAVNYFGAIATLDGLRSLLEASSAPRAAVISSFAAIEAIDDSLLDLLESGDEVAALAHAEEIVTSDPESLALYTTSKRAIARWVRRMAPTPQWAGAGIALNAIAPGVIETPMTKPALEIEEVREALFARGPAPLNGPTAPPSAPAALLDWLTSTENSYVTGQVIFIDGGAESLLRPDTV